MKKKTPWIIVSLCLALFFVSIIVSIIKYESFLYAMENFLVVNEEPKPADVIIILGGGTGEEVDHGISLYQSGYAGRILLAGGSDSGGTTEAQIMKRQALSLGVPEDHILLEEESLSTYENAKYSLEIMRTKRFKSAILVTSPYHTRRASIIFDRFFKGMDLTTSSAPYDSSNPSKWWKDSRRATAIRSEYLKLIWHYLFYVWFS